MANLVSIIIPTYNRAELLEYTLDSIRAQTYIHWECIVIDDGSSDATHQMMEDYCINDERFKFLERPGNKPKGANACRNYGLLNCKGDFVVFFDSDDLMTEDHLEIKHSAIEKGDYDYIITKTKYLNRDVVDEFYDFKSKDINNHNYITQKVNWLTYDVIIKRQLATTIRFNECLQSGQEFNYFSKLTLKSTNSILVDSYVTLRRFHEDSIRAPLRNNKNRLVRSRYEAHWLTYRDLRRYLHKETRIYLMRKCVGLFFEFEKFHKSFDLSFSHALWKELGCKKAIFYCLANFANAAFGKSYLFVKKVRS